ncbi:MAG: hypothetical protein ABIO72_05590 [Patescibacteria group bacterium]
MKLSLPVRKTLKLLGIFLASFALANTIIFFSQLFIGLPNTAAICESDCNIQEQTTLTAAWGSYRQHGLILFVCLAVVFMIAATAYKQRGVVKLLGYSITAWLTLVALVTAVSGRDFYIQLANPTPSTRQLAWAAFQWLIIALIPLGLLFLARPRTKEKT